MNTEDVERLLFESLRSAALAYLVKQGTYAFTTAEYKEAWRAANGYSGPEASDAVVESQLQDCLHVTQFTGNDTWLIKMSFVEIVDRGDPL